MALSVKKKGKPSKALRSAGALRALCHSAEGTGVEEALLEVNQTLTPNISYNPVSPFKSSNSSQDKSILNGRTIYSFVTGIYKVSMGTAGSAPATLTTEHESVVAPWLTMTMNKTQREFPSPQMRPLKRSSQRERTLG